MKSRNEPPDKPLPFECYQAGRFADIAADPLAARIWAYVSTPRVVCEMLTAAEQGRSPMEPIGHELQQLFGGSIQASGHDTDLVHTMVNNMVKQLMERHGYVLVACTLLRNCPFCSSAGLFAKAAE